MSLIRTAKSGIYNFFRGTREKKKNSILQAEMQKKCLIGKSSVITNPNLIINHNDSNNNIRIGNQTHILGQIIAYKGGSVEIGDCCYVSVDSRIWSFTSVKIGNRVLIAHNVNIFDSQTHSFNHIHRHQEFMHVLFNSESPQDMHIGRAPVFIDDDAWIACGAIILRGVSVGRGAIVGAGSVVTKNVPPWTLVAGNPARVIRELDNEGSEVLENAFYQV